MFGMGFLEILIIAVIAILFLGPDKLPGAMVDVAKFFRNMKNTIGTVKETFEEEINVNEIKKEALAYKQDLLDASERLENTVNVEAHVKNQVNSIKESVLDEAPSQTFNKAPSTPEEVTFKKNKLTQEEESTNV